jgi:hypothetical protein
VTVSNPDSLFSNETGLILEEEAEGRLYLSETDVKKPLVVSGSQKKVKSCDSTAWFRI